LCDTQPSRRYYTIAIPTNAARVDYQIEQWLNAPAGQHAALDTVMRDAANWGEWIFIGLVVAWFASAWLWGDRTERRFALTALLASGIALGVNQIFGAIWNRPRPFVAHPLDVHLLVTHAADGSFPSDHAAAGFAIAGVLLAAHRRFGMLAIAAAVLMSYARVFAGLHYPGDVAAGALIGFGASLVLVRFAAWPVEWLETNIERYVAVVRLPIPRADRRFPPGDAADPAPENPARDRFPAA
jgi:undecaprenyl-diphosphatase